MPIEHLRPSALCRKQWRAFCFSCGKEAANATDDAVWTIWAPEMVYCPSCAKDEGIGPDDY